MLGEMTKTSVAMATLLSVLAATGCKKKDMTGDPHVVNCSNAVEKYMSVSAGDTGMANVTDEIRSRIRAVELKHCMDDKWSPEVLTCMTSASATTDLSTCDGMQTPEQRDAAHKDLAGAMATEPKPSPGSAVPAVLGSGSGSAGSGSAIVVAPTGIGSDVPAAGSGSAM